MTLVCTLCYELEPELQLCDAGGQLGGTMQ
jgi:hypothetical protein